MRYFIIFFWKIYGLSDLNLQKEGHKLLDINIFFVIYNYSNIGLNSLIMNRFGDIKWDQLLVGFCKNHWCVMLLYITNVVLFCLIWSAI